MNIEKHYTVSIYIVHKDKVLLHQHKKYNKLLPLGGHIEENELPEEACIREAKEESGLDITLYNSDHTWTSTNKDKSSSVISFSEDVLVNPMHTILCEVNPEHYHIDLVFYGLADSFETSPEIGESKELKWYDIESLKALEKISPRVYALAKEALQLLATSSI